MFRHILILILLTATSLTAYAQSRSSDNSSPLIPGNEKDWAAPGSPAEELIHRAAIRREENAFKEMIERAKENARLSSELSSSFESRKTLGVEDLKKLERIEKLARKIRSGAGGSDDDEPLADPPEDAGGAVKRLADVSGDLLKKVEKTSRMITSAAVIKRSNELIELTRHVRKFFGR